MIEPWLPMFEPWHPMKKIVLPRAAAHRMAAVVGFILAVVAVTLVVPWPAAVGADVHVATNGSDSAAGTAAAPVATLRRALDRVREIRAAEPGRTTPVVVELGDGRHVLAETLVLVPEDSGTEASPTVIRAAASPRVAIASRTRASMALRTDS